MAYRYPKCDNFGLRSSRDMVGAHKNLNGLYVSNASLGMKDYH